MPREGGAAQNTMAVIPVISGRRMKPSSCSDALFLLNDDMVGTRNICNTTNLEINHIQNHYIIYQSNNPLHFAFTKA